MNVERLMTKDPVSVTIPNTRGEVLQLLVKNKKTGLPVVNGNNEVVGVITRKHIFDKPDEEQLALLMDTEPPMVSPTTKVSKAAQILSEKDTYRLPVVKNGQLVGIITPTDLLKVVVERKIEKPIEELLYHNCVPISRNTTLKAAARIIKVSKVYCLPVLDNEGIICGLMTDRDLYKLSYVDEKLDLTELGISNDEDEWNWEGLRNVMPLYFEANKVELPDAMVGEVMTGQMDTVYRKTPAWEAATMMLKNDYGQLPVRDDDDSLISLVYDLDIIRVLAD